MAFDTLERSIFGGSPIELYEFFILGQAWRYTTDDRTVTFNGADYLAAPLLMRDSIRVTGNIDRSTFTVKVRGDFPIADEFRVAPPSEPVQLRIYKKHRGDSDFIINWRGRVNGCVWEEDVAVLQCTPITSSMKQPGLRRAYSLQCPFALYDSACRVDRNEFIVVGEVTAMSGLDITLDTAAGLDTDWFAGGYVLWENATGRQDTRMVTASTAAGVLTVQNTTIGLEVGSVLQAYPGCDHNISTCVSKFNNSERFGGFPFIPKTNPFGGATIY